MLKYITPALTERNWPDRVNSAAYRVLCMVSLFEVGMA